MLVSASSLDTFPVGFQKYVREYFAEYVSNETSAGGPLLFALRAPDFPVTVNVKKGRAPSGSDAVSCCFFEGFPEGMNLESWINQIQDPRVHVFNF